MTILERRLSRLETSSGGNGRLIVFEAPDGTDEDKALSELGIEIDQSDLTVMIRLFLSQEPPRLVSIKELHLH